MTGLSDAGGAGAGAGGRRADRGAAGNLALVRIVGAHLLAVVTEYAAVVAVLVHAFDEGGARATGVVSLALLAAGLAGGLAAIDLTNRLRPALVRNAGLAVQALGYGVAAGAVAAGHPWLAVAGAVAALGAVGTLRPTGAALLPAVARTSGELTLANVWVSRCEAIGALVGPLAAAALLWLGGPSTALVGCSVLAAGALVTTLVGRSGAHHGPPAAAVDRPFAAARAAVRHRPATASLLAVVLARYVVLGALDVLLVVLAFGALDLGSGGVGVLNALLGAGALASTAVVTVVVRRARLAPVIAVSLLAAAVLCLAFGVATTVPVALVVVPLLGLGVALLDGLGRLLLQRSVDPGSLAGLFSVVELVGGVGLLVGSGVAQLVIALADEHLALVAVGLVLALIGATSARAVWHADASADIPVVEMSLLRELPMFAPLPPVALEALARTATYEVVEPGVDVVRQGEPGDRFYAVAGGAFDVVMGGEHIREARRGSFFGEVALLADVPRTATVSTRDGGELLAVDRVSFLVAVTGSDTSAAAAWGVVRSLRLDTALPDRGPGRGADGGGADGGGADGGGGDLEPPQPPQTSGVG